MTTKERLEARLTVLLRDHDFRYTGDLLIRKGVRGWSDDQIIGRHPTIMVAAESRLGMLSSQDQAEYSQRYHDITKPA